MVQEVLKTSVLVFRILTIELWEEKRKMYQSVVASLVL